MGGSWRSGDGFPPESLPRPSRSRPRQKAGRDCLGERAIPSGAALSSARQKGECTCDGRPHCRPDASGRPLRDRRRIPGLAVASGGRTSSDGIAGNGHPGALRGRRDGTASSLRPGHAAYGGVFVVMSILWAWRSTVSGRTIEIWPEPSSSSWESPSWSSVREDDPGVRPVFHQVIPDASPSLCLRPGRSSLQEAGSSVNAGNKVS